MKLLQKIYECFISKPNALGTFLNLHISINLKDISETNIPIELKFCMFSIFEA